MVVKSDGNIVLLTRAPDLRQARHTSIVEDIRIWIDRGGVLPVRQLKDLLFELDLLGARLGVEYSAHGLNGADGRQLDDMLTGFAEHGDASSLISTLRAIKSPAEIDYIRQAGHLADAAYEAGLTLIRPGADEGHVLAAMQGVIFEGGGDYPGNDFIIGSGRDALLCRSKSGRRQLDAQDQITLEFAAAYRHYHAALMRTVIVGAPTERHLELDEAVRAALAACEEKLRAGFTFGEVFDAHAATLDARGLARHRLNACGYSLGARFAPSWMDPPMAYHANPTVVVPNMVVFLHMIVMDSDSGAAMSLGRTYITSAGAPEPLSKMPLDLPLRWP